MTGDAISAVPPGARLIHIGFNKTGTTSLQGALKAARGKLPAHGVVYPGEDRYHKRPGIYIAGAVGRLGDRPTTEADWQELVDSVTDAGNHRVLVSSEWLCQAPDAAVGRVVRDLGGERVHVIATVRPLAKILPSSWQQFLQNGLRVDYDSWLRGMLLEPPYEKPTPTFWQRHRHDEVLARWAKYAGADHVTAIIVDSKDHSKVFRQFETLLDLPAGILVPEPPEKDNRSLTWPEAELLRHVNDVFKKRGWPDSLYRSAVRSGFVSRLAALRPSSSDMPKIGMPKWAAERAAEIGAEAAANIARLGINVIGDLDSLGRMPTDVDETDTPPALLPADIAAEAIIGAIAGSRAAGRREGRTGSSIQTPEGRAAIELPPGATKLLKRARDRANGVRYRLRRLTRSS